MPPTRPESLPTPLVKSRLLEAPNVKDFLVKNKDQLGLPPLHEYITDLCLALGLSRGEVIKRAGIDRTYGHQLFNSRRKPSRDKVIQLAFGLGLDEEGTQRLLQVARKSALYVKDERDAAILFCIQHQKSIDETQGLLEDIHATLLGGDDING